MPVLRILEGALPPKIWTFSNSKIYSGAKETAVTCYTSTSINIYKHSDLLICVLPPPPSVQEPATVSFVNYVNM